MLSTVQAMELIFKCKQVAGRVSPKVWNGIENRFLTLDSMKVGRTRDTKAIDKDNTTVYNLQ